MWKAVASKAAQAPLWRQGRSMYKVLPKQPARAWRQTTVQAARAMASSTSDTPKRTMQTVAPMPQLQEKEVSKTAPESAEKYVAMDGNEAAAYVAYALSDISFIYPISPATSMGDHMDKWASLETKNIFGSTVDVNMMQSEGGAAGALHGAAAAGALSSTFTASQGLLLMIPNMYLLAGELVPTVFHVSARTVSKHALSIFNDHSDVMATRQTGFAMLCSSSVQEVMDLALVSHIASVKARLPFMHFFDGYRTSAEVSKIKPIPYSAMAEIFPDDLAQKHLRDFALNPNKPMIRGTGQRPDIFFQSTVAANKYYNECPSIVEQTLEEVYAITGRKYNLFDYHGSPTADRVAVIMGSGAKTIEETVDYLNAKGENVGVVNVHLFRPWSSKHLLAAIPQSATKIAVLDRTREDGAAGMPLFLDVNVAFSDAKRQALITGGQYGLASKEFTPEMVQAVFENLNAEKPKESYVIGIEDDVTHTSLPYGAPLKTIPEGTKQCIFWGLGSDGTVGAAKEAIKTIGLNTPLKAQGHFVYDSHKADGVTISHVRFGPEDIKSEYTIHSDADYVSCAHPSYVYKFNQLLEPLKPGGTFVLNSPWVTMEEMQAKLPALIKQQIAEKKLQFYNIDAIGLAAKVGLGKRINMIMQAAFYELSGVLPVEDAMQLLKRSIEKSYGHKGPKIVESNQSAVDSARKSIQKIDYPSSWDRSDANAAKKSASNEPEFVEKIMHPVLALEGDKLPVSAFEPGGYMPIGTTEYEKRGIAPNIPVWIPDACTQCNYCAIVCPHAVVRPFLLDKNEAKSAPPGFEARKAKGGAEVSGFNYTIQISPMDCTGCEVCVESCPDDALYMAPFNEVAEKYRPHWDYAIKLDEKGEIGDKFTVKGSQFEKPLMEFSGACAGCGETPYMKLATQLFGDKMVIANSSGCSSVWGGTAAAVPFTTSKDGRGPAWGRSLFEDTAEYGFGMMLATKQRRRMLQKDVELAMENVPLSEELHSLFGKWVKNMDSSAHCDNLAPMIEEALEKEKDKDPILQRLHQQRDLFRTQSHWLVGGDGWAYDIGYGGLDHVISKGENVNILVLDTEMYSNTGGQVSKATQLSTVTKFASSGKRHVKKDLGMMAMLYENVYVASVALGANMNQTVQAFKEAESYNGTSIIIAYSPCIDWGIEMKNMMHEQKEAVESGYWTLYRFDPRKADLGQNPFQLDSKRIKGDLHEFLHQQNRFQQLVRKNKDEAALLHTSLHDISSHRHKKLLKMAMDEHELLEHLKNLLGEEVSTEKSIILYGSETGNAENLAHVFSTELKRRGIRAKCLAMDDFDVEELPSQANVYCIVATCGQGEFPGNCKNFWEQLSKPDLPADFLENTKFAVFGLGDTSYVFYNESAKAFDKRLEELGAQRILDIGLGDDKDDEKYETAWSDWCPNLWNELGTPPPPQELMPPTYRVEVDTTGSVSAPKDAIVPSGYKLVPMTKNVVLTPPDYDRDIRHYEFDLKESGMQYAIGECLGIYPHNNIDEVINFLAECNIGPDNVITLEDTTGRKDPLPAVATASQLFQEVLDVFGRPSRRFYETLALAATDENEKKEIEYIISKEGTEKYKEMISETTTFADLLRKYPSAKLPLDYMVDHIPRIKPRLYSIASASEMHGDKLHLCIVKDDWTTPSGKYRRGLCTHYLQNLGLGESPDFISGKINAAGITIPDSHKPPFVMVGLGTGLAPFRAFIEEREVCRTRGEDVGEMALFFGARHKRTDYTYGDELEEYHSNGKGVLTVLSNAFSRDQAHKIYVQNRIQEHPEIIYDYLMKKKGYFYLCGPAGNVPPAVRQAVVDAFVKVGGHKPEEADKMVTDMQIEGRYNVEAW
ncbi:pyruvate:ferredoxin oxidoreductase-like [Liolophura sinensis]|uniref:pyruvate:ferredoxin oxidoreductase-like n=1 Tax=Liolophura sinensis TaxID=3198878 RepID=UPI00315914AB